MKDKTVFQEIDPKNGSPTKKPSMYEKAKEAVSHKFHELKESAKEKAREFNEMKKEEKEVRHEAYRKERLNIARRKGKEQAQGGLFGGLGSGLSSRVAKAPPETKIASQSNSFSHLSIGMNDDYLNKPKKEKKEMEGWF